MQFSTNQTNGRNDSWEFILDQLIENKTYLQPEPTTIVDIRSDKEVRWEFFFIENHRGVFRLLEEVVWRKVYIGDRLAEAFYRT